MCSSEIGAVELKNNPRQSLGKKLTDTSGGEISLTYAKLIPNNHELNKKYIILPRLVNLFL